MGSITDYLENEILDHVLGTGAYTRPTIYIALGTAADDTGLTTEVSGTDYARVAHASWTSAASRVTSNSGTVTFPAAGAGGWGSPSYWAIYDASTAGNCLAVGSISPVSAVNASDVVSFASGALQVAFNASAGGIGWSSYLVHKVLDHVFSATSYTAETLYAGFTTAAMTDTSSITGEASGGGYARVATGSFAAASGGVADNSAAITFTVSGDWTAALDNIIVTNHATNSAATNLLFFGTTTSFSALNGDTVEISIGDLNIQVS